jgi:serine/threonine protein kinase
MAPELVSGEQYSTPVDIWALGIVALELAEKEPPHITTPPIRTVYIIASQPAPTLKTPEKFSAEFRSFVSRCLVKSPDARATASELMSHPFIAKACTQAEFADYIGQWKRGELDDDN